MTPSIELPEVKEGTLVMKNNVITITHAKMVATRIQKDASPPVHRIRFVGCEITRWNGMDDIILGLIRDGKSAVRTLELVGMRIRESTADVICACLKARRLRSLTLRFCEIKRANTVIGFGKIADALVDSGLVELCILDRNGRIGCVFESLPLSLEFLQIDGYETMDVKYLQRILCHGKLKGLHIGFFYRDTAYWYKEDQDEFFDALSRSTVEILFIDSWVMIDEFIRRGFPVGLKELHFHPTMCMRVHRIANALLKQKKSQLRLLDVPVSTALYSRGGEEEMYTVLTEVAQQLPSLHTITTKTNADGRLKHLIMMLHAQRVCEVLVSPSVIGRLGKNLHLPVDIMMFWLVPMMTGVNPWKQ